MPYPIPNATGPLELFAYANTVTDGLFWPIILMAIYAIVFLSMASKPTHAVVASGFVTGIAAGLMFAAHLVNEWTFLLSIVAAIGGLVLLIFSDYE